MRNSYMSRTSKVLLRLGQILLINGIICLTVSIGTAHWVIRPTIDFQKQKINPNKTLIVKNYGIFVACRQSEDYAVASVDCGSLLDNLNFINDGTARYIQFVMCLAMLLYAASLSLEVVQRLPIKKYRNFIAQNRMVEMFAGIANYGTARYIQFVMCLAMLLYAASLSLEVVQRLPIKRYRNFIAQNRMVEMFAGIASVMVLHSMTMFAGEIKNKADRLPGQDDETHGWSFAVAVTGITLNIVGLLLVTMFRDLPIAMPEECGGSWLRPALKKATTLAEVRC